MPPAPIHRDVQLRAKKVLEVLADSIGPRSTERSIVGDAKRLLAAQGLYETWYYDCPAFVLLGTRSCLSISGRNYQPSDEPVGDENLVTIDLSPQLGNALGDCARSFCVEDGRVVHCPKSIEFQNGIETENRLHARMRGFVTPSTSFHELFEFANDAIIEAGYENLDFLDNVGHSIALTREQRCFIERGNSRLLSEVACFTFEPHIRQQNGRWGFKHENIYFFNDAQIIEEL